MVIQAYIVYDAKLFLFLFHQIVGWISLTRPSKELYEYYIDSMRIFEDIESNWNICCKYRRINVQRKSICETCKLRQSQLDTFLYTHNYGSAAFLLEHDNLSVNWSWQKVIKRFLIKGKLFVLQKFQDNAIEIHDDFDIPLVDVSILIQSIVML